MLPWKQLLANVAYNQITTSLYCNKQIHNDIPTKLQD